MSEWRFRTKESDPWLSKAEITKINWPYTQKGQERIAACRDFFTLAPFLDESSRVRLQEPILKRRYENPLESFEAERGGWLCENTVFHGSQTATDLAYRQACRANGFMDEADLVRRVVLGGSVEIRDFPDGTMWFYGKGIVY